MNIFSRHTGIKNELKRFGLIHQSFPDAPTIRLVAYEKDIPAIKGLLFLNEIPSNKVKIYPVERTDIFATKLEGVISVIEPVKIKEHLHAYHRLK